uniref:DNA polymerase processivity factor n=1 Tax=Hipposideros bat herpesvirus TaxID=3141919 RepID=A0AAU7E260_9VIRU
MEPGKKYREQEPPTLALRLKPYKMAIQQLRSVLRMLRDNTTVTFLPTPAMVLQTVKTHHISKITFNSLCLYINDRTFKPRTINNVIPVIGSFIYMTSSKDLIKFNIVDTSDLCTMFQMTASDFSMEFRCACVHGQDIVRDNGESTCKLDLDYSVVCELIKWLSPHTRVKRNAKKQVQNVGTVQVLIHANPPTIKFCLSSSSELEFTASSRVSFHEVKNTRLTLQIKNLYQALTNCAVTKVSCTLRVITEHDVMLYAASKSNVFTVENFITEEPFTRNEFEFDRQSAKATFNNVSISTDACESMENDNADDHPVPAKKHDRGASRKGDQEHASQQNKYEQNKITSYMTKGGSSNTVERNAFFDGKEESDSDDSVTFEFVSSGKKQKCP